jgi:hypothetical protein
MNQCHSWLVRAQKQSEPVRLQEVLLKDAIILGRDQAATSAVVAPIMEVSLVAALNRLGPIMRACSASSRNDEV